MKLVIVSILFGICGHPFIALWLLVFAGVNNIATGLSCLLSKLESVSSTVSAIHNLSISSDQRVKDIHVKLTSIQFCLGPLIDDVSSLKPKQVKTHLKPRKTYLSMQRIH